MELTQLERAILCWISKRNPHLTKSLQSIVPTARQHTGAGRYVEFGTPERRWRGHVDGPTYQGKGLEHGGGSILWLADGEPACLEMYAHGNDCPEVIEDHVLDPG
mgnify:FL=1